MVFYPSHRIVVRDRKKSTARFIKSVDKELGNQDSVGLVKGVQRKPNRESGEKKGVVGITKEIGRRARIS